MPWSSRADTRAQRCADLRGAKVVVLGVATHVGTGARPSGRTPASDMGRGLESKGRLVPFGIEVMGRAQELGTLDDVLAISSKFEWVRPVPDFAHMHATSDGAFTTVERFGTALEAVDRALPPDVPFHIHFSDVSYANRNEKAHVPYGQATLRPEPRAE